MILDKMQFLLGFCFSPPVHATDDEMEAYYLAAVKPFVGIAYRYPDVPLTLSFSGPFLDWLQNHHSEYLAVLTEMIKRKQVEVLGGGYFAPLLPLIPPTDRLGQIEELTTLVRKLLGKRPRGLWLTKGVWDPALVVHLTGSGMEYTFLEEGDFRRVGLSQHQVGLPRLTENQGRLLTVFPYHQDLAQRVQEGDFEAFTAVVPARKRRDRQLLSLFLQVDSPADGAFFTRTENGLEAFLSLVRSFYPEIEAVTASGFLKKNQLALERSYFPPTTYDELCRRSGQPNRPSSGSQSWKQFLAYDEEANQLYNKMVYVHLLVSSLRGDKYKKKSAYDDLWKAQNWWGFLGGGSETDLAQHRQKAFAALLNAEALLRDRSRFQASLTSQDFDLDGVREFLFQGQNYNLYVDAVGGQVFEWDFLERPWNCIGGGPTDPEGPRPQAFVDRFFRIDRPGVDAARFFHREYRLVELNREQKTFQLMAVEPVDGLQGRQPLRLKKTYSFQDEALTVDYELELLTGPSWEGWFSTEMNLTYPVPLQVSGEVQGTEAEAGGFTVTDGARKSAQVWRWEPRAAVAFEGGRMAPRWWMILHPGETWRARISLTMLRAE
jgi:alpha-amylase